MPIFQENLGGLAVTFRFKTPISQDNSDRNIEAMNLRQKMIAEFLKEVKTATTGEVLNYLVSINIPAFTHRTILRDLGHLQTIGIVNLKDQKRGRVWIFQENSL